MVVSVKWKCSSVLSHCALVSLGSRASVSPLSRWRSTAAVWCYTEERNEHLWITYGIFASVHLLPQCCAERTLCIQKNTSAVTHTRSHHWSYRQLTDPISVTFWWLCWWWIIREQKFVWFVFFKRINGLMWRCVISLWQFELTETRPYSDDCDQKERRKGEERFWWASHINLYSAFVP